MAAPGAPLALICSHKRTATEAGLPEAASAPAAPAAKQAKENATPVIEVVPASKPKEVIEVEAPRANAA